MGGRGNKGITPEVTPLPTKTLSDMRAVHSKLQDDQFEARTVQVIGSIDPDALKIPARRAASSPPGALALPFRLNRHRFMSNTPGC